MTAPQRSADSWHDLLRLADITEQLGCILGNLPRNAMSKETGAALLGTGPRLVATASVLRQAARETNAALRLTDGLARMDPDKRREHAIDDQLDALGDVEAS